MMRYKVILPGMLLAASAFPALAAPGRYAITAEQVAASVTRYGIEIGPDQVKLLSGVVATTTAPRLTVRSIHPWGTERMMARLECESREECLPFFVGLEVARNSGSMIGGKASAQDGNLGPAAAPTPKAYLLRKGAPATLQLDGDRVHIRISVICLENGVLGQTIRVTGKDHRLVYTAQVLDADLLTGRL